MPSHGRFHSKIVHVIRIAACTIAIAAPAVHAAAQGLPQRLSDSTFWRMVTEFSEPGGQFRSDNFVSNESAYQYVIPVLQSTIRPGGVYVGVGPDQNFTYLVAFEPRIAFIVDIRRQNMLQHLMYKALIEMSEDRAAFLSLLFSRPRPAGLDESATAQRLFEAFKAAAPDTVLYRVTTAAIRRHLSQVHGFSLSDDDYAGLNYVFGSFYSAGPDITYNFGTGTRGAFGGMNGFGMPSYADLQMESDGQGKNRAYMGSEANYRVLRELEMRNLVVPIVGDFSGPKALRTVGQYLRDKSASVSVFYTSNVEQYLFQQGDEWSRFYTNVSTMPVDSTATFIRSLSNRGWVTSQNPASRSAQLYASMNELITAFRAGRIDSYYSVIALSKQ